MYRITVLQLTRGPSDNLVRSVQFNEDPVQGERNARVQFGDKYRYVVEHVDYTGVPFEDDPEV